MRRFMGLVLASLAMSIGMTLLVTLTTRALRAHRAEWRQRFGAACEEATPPVA